MLCTFPIVGPILPTVLMLPDVPHLVVQSPPTFGSEIALSVEIVLGHVDGVADDFGAATESRSDSPLLDTHHTEINAVAVNCAEVLTLRVAENTRRLAQTQQ